MEKSKSYLELERNKNLIGQILTHKLSKSQILISDITRDVNPNDANDYFINVLVKHNTTGSLEHLDLEHIKKYYL